MTTYYEQVPTLLDRIRHADVIAVIRDWKVERVLPDPMSETERQFADVAMVPERMLRGEDRALRVRLVGQAGKDGATWAINLDAPRRVVVMLQRDVDGTYVPYFGSLFPMKGNEIRLPSGTRDDRTDTKRPLTVPSLARLVRKIDEEAEERSEQWRDNEPKATAIPGVSEAPEDFVGARPVEYGPKPPTARRARRR